MLYPTADVAGRLVGPLADVAIGALEGPPIFGEGTEPPELTARTAGQLAGMVLPFGAMRRGASAVSGPARRRLLTAGEPIRAYHGGPSIFKKFDPEYIGTGEGAQTYGQGFYFTEPEKIGNWYRENLTPRSFRHTESLEPLAPLGPDSILWNRDTPTYEVDLAARNAARQLIDKSDDLRDFFTRRQGRGETPLQRHPSTYEPGSGTFKIMPPEMLIPRGRPALMFQYEDVSRGPLWGVSADEASTRAAAFVNDAVSEGASPLLLATKYEMIGEPEFTQLVRAAAEQWIGIGPHRGALYEVGIHASPEELLDLGKPLAQQSRQVQGPVHDIFDPLHLDPDATMAWARRHPNLFRSPQDALSTERTGLLSERGVPGAQYRGRSSGARNYVIWDDERLEILKRTLPAIIAALAAGSDSSESPQVRRRVN